VFSVSGSLPAEFAQELFVSIILYVIYYTLCGIGLASVQVAKSFEQRRPLLLRFENYRFLSGRILQNFPGLLTAIPIGERGFT
jgi:hypothetical protein